MIKPSDPSFDRLMNYQFQQLYDTTLICSVENSRKLQEQVKTFRATLQNMEFGAEHPVMVFDFLTGL